MKPRRARSAPHSVVSSRASRFCSKSTKPPEALHLIPRRQVGRQHSPDALNCFRDFTVTSQLAPSGVETSSAVHSYSVRICHWINVIACGYLLVSGVHILLDFPELYWGHTGYRGYPAIFKLSDWGLSWEAAGKLGDRRWGRNYHVTFAWVFLINGLVYVAWNLYTTHFRKRMLPARAS